MLEHQCCWVAKILDAFSKRGDFIVAISITLVPVMIPVINYSSGIGLTFSLAFVQNKTVVL